ncbi:MAG: VapC toxin family PIN domain ribonuclease [Thiotrichaceae bacterium IS1]|nr:MAG: VapC toxin family PIN domain ribonuclease [Thiotrichaceae bacterium IS1]
MLLLDTDVMIDIFRNHLPARSWLQSLGTETLGVTGFTVMELLQGCRNQLEQQKVQKMLLAYTVVWPQPIDCERALTTYANFHLSDSLGILDALIAQTAVGLQMTLVTFNTKHYRVVPHLQTIRPYAR